MEKENIKKFSEGLRRYCLLIEGKYDWIPIVHFVYWNKEEEVVCDRRADIGGPGDIEQWISLKEKEIRKGYLTFGLDSSNFKLKCEIKNDINLLLLVYIGKEIEPADEGIDLSNRRAVIYQPKKLNLSHLKEMVEWGIKRYKTLKAIGEMDKPSIFHQAVEKKYGETQKPFSYLFES